MKLYQVAAIIVGLALVALVGPSDAYAAGVATIHAAAIVPHALDLHTFAMAVAGAAAVDIKKLRQTRADSAKKGREKVTALNALLGKDNATEEEKAQITTLDGEVTALETEVEQLDAQIAAEEKKIRRTNLFNASTALNVRPGARFAVNEPNPETTGGFHSLSEFAVAVRNQVMGNGADPRLTAAPSNFQQNQGASGEGFLVPAEYRQNIWELVFADNDLLAMCNQEPTSSNAIKIPKDETTPWGASGVQSAWRAEAGQMSASKIALTGTILELHELYAFVLATSELLEDAPRLNNRLTTQAARAIKWKASDAVVWGDGNGKPLGFMNAGCLVTVSKESGQASGSLDIKNLFKMYSRLLRTGGSPVWLMNADVMPAVASLTFGNVPAWLPNNAPITGAPGDGNILGRPVYFNEHMKSLNTLGDIAFADLSGYALATKSGGGIDFAASIHLYFDYNIQAFRWTFRVGGHPYLSAAVSPANGSNTKSHFVTLQAR